jgi:hypothetical protein
MVARLKFGEVKRQLKGPASGTLSKIFSKSFARPKSRFSGTLHTDVRLPIFIRRQQVGLRVPRCAAT